MATNKLLRHINSLRLQIRICRNESNCSSAFLTAISQKHVNQSFSIPHVLTKCRYTKSIKNSSELRSTDGLCWNCRKNVQNSKFFCPSCGAALPVEKSENYFTLFDLQTDFIISLPDLQQKFKELQKLLHPDKFSLKSATEQEVSQSVSSKINKAYFCLAKPLSRGLYMLKLQGIHLGEDVTADDPDFLMEIMEINEEVADASIDQLKEIQSSIKAILSKLTLQIAREFHDNNFEMAKQHLIKFKYYNNIDEKLKEMIPPV